MIFLLKGDKYTWVYPKDFILPISARGEIERLIREGHSVFGKENPASLSQWIPTKKKLSEDEWYAANNDGTTWDVYLEGEEVKIRRYNFDSETDAALKMRDGSLVSENRGEFGAAVFWDSNEGKRSKISGHHIEQFIQLGTRTLALSGLAHGDSNIGEVLEFKREVDGWIVSRIAELKDAPIKAIRESESSLLVLTYSSLSRVTLAGKTKLIVTKGEWDGLIPRSLIMDGKGFAYVGFRQRVAKVELKTGKVIYLIPYPEIFSEALKLHNERRQR
jgi:hypothetical protein